MIPASTQRPRFSIASGPPESPVQESPSVPLKCPAQNMFLVTLYLCDFLHVVCFTTGAIALRMRLTSRLPCPFPPQPMLRIIVRISRR